MRTVTNETLNEWECWQLAGGYSQRTVEERSITIRRCATINNTDPTALTAREITMWLASCTHWAPSTRATFHGHLLAWFKWLHSMRYRLDNPMHQVPTPRRPRSEPKPISNEEMARLFTVLNRRKTRAMVHLGALQGARAHEIAKVHGRDFNLDTKTMSIAGKGNVTATLPLHPRVADLVVTMPRDGYWFPSNRGGHVHWRSVSDVIRKAMMRADVPGSAHSLRHWFATELVKSGADLRTVQKLLRHASLATTQIYVDVADTRKREAIERLDFLDAVFGAAA